MKVVVLVQRQPLEIEVGEGHQSFRWLAQVVSARIKRFKVLRATFEEEKQLVLRLTHQNGTEIDPNSEICDGVEDGSSIVAEVTDSVPSDSHGNVALTSWMQDAYVQSGAHIAFIRGNEAWKRNPTRMRTATAQDTASDSLIFVGELTDADVATAFELDWPLIDWSWVFDDPDEKFMYQLKDNLRDHYGPLCCIFTHYAGHGRREWHLTYLRITII